MGKIAVLGCGTWGSALAQGLAENGHIVHAWHHRADFVAEMAYSRKHPRLDQFTFHKNINFEPDILRITNDADKIICAAPSHAVREIMMKLKGNISQKAIIVNVAKGIENGTLDTMSEVISKETGHNTNYIVSLYGPSHAEEVISGHPTTLVAASIFHESAEKVQAVFSSNILRVYTNHDILGVELGGSLKNVIAIAAGICDGIGFGDNTKAALMTRGLTEITRLGEAMGAEKNTFFGLSGIGDLIATCFSQHSRNRFVGEEIGRGKSLSNTFDEMDMVAEGVKTTQSVHDLAKIHKVEMPISEGVYQVLFNDKDPKKVVSSLMARDLRHEQISA